MSKESPVSVGDDAYVDLDRQVSKIRFFFSFNLRASVPSHLDLLRSLSLSNRERPLWEINIRSGKLSFSILNYLAL